MTLEQLLDGLEDTGAYRQQSTKSAAPSSLPAAPSLVELTRRESEVLRLLSQGLTDAQIAERLAITRRTVNWYLTRIYRKCGVSSRRAATQYAREYGML